MSQGLRRSIAAFTLLLVTVWIGACGGSSSGTSAPVVASLTTSSTSLTFPSTALGTTSAAQTITVTNPGTVAITIGSATPTGANPGDFVLTASTCGTSIPAGGSCIASIAFAPAGIGARSASFAVVNSGGTSPINVTLAGTGTPATITASPASLTFASTNVGASSASQSSTIGNPGAIPIAITGITITGAQASDFTLTSNTCGSSIAANGTCSVGVAFAPTATGTRTATVAIANGGATSPYTIGLIGTAVAPAIAVSLNQTSATVALGTTQNFTATVANDSTNSGVTWSIGTGVGSLASTSITAATYQSPAGLPAAGSVTLTATSIKDTTKSASATITIPAPTAPASQWVSYNAAGNLTYKPVPSTTIPNTNGHDQIMDFSTAGYNAGVGPVPTAPVVATVSPSGGDDTANIQNAINTVANATLNTTTGLRGAVLLNPGSYTVSGTLNVTASGVVLRGSGSGNSPTANTVITMTAASTPYPLVNLGNAANVPVYTGSNVTVTDTYVPAGSSTLNVSSTAGFTVGQEVMIKRPTTAAWVTFMKMNPTDIQPSAACSSGTCNWISPSASTFKTDRFITAINGNTITLDSPISDSFDSAYLGVGGVTVQAFTIPNRTVNSGVENFRIITPVPPTNLVPPTASYQMVVAYSALNCWIRNLTSQDALEAIDIESYTKQILVSNVSITHTVTQTASAKFEEFYINGGTQVLFDTISDTTDNMFFFSTSSATQGPNVVRNGVFKGSTSIEPHQRWATGLLIENTTVGAVNTGGAAGQINLYDRGSFGSGQGWAIGWGVIWNSTASGFEVQLPPGSENWCIGCIGTQIVTAAPGGATPGLGAFDSQNTYVFPTSLYQAQLTQRLGAGAVAQ